MKTCKGCEFQEPKQGGFCYMWKEEPTGCYYGARYLCPVCNGTGFITFVGEEEHICKEECYCNGGFVPAFSK